MRAELHLHIGAPKTGTSAIQAWLDDSVKLLSDHGYYHPQSCISSKCGDTVLMYGGNTRLSSLIFKTLHNFEDTRPERYLEELMEKASARCLLLSAETFSAVSPEFLKRFAAVCHRCSVRADITFFIRDLYPFFYSLYNQTCKRRFYGYSFRDFVIEKKEVTKYIYPDSKYFYCDPLETERLYAECPFVRKINIIHYDAIKSRGAVAAFADILSLSLSLSSQHYKRANLSLAPAQLEVYRRVIKAMHTLSYSENLIGAVASLLEKVYLVKLPGICWRSEGIPYYDDIYDYLEEKYADSIRRFNDKYGIALAVLNKKENVIPVSADAEKVYDELCQQILRDIAMMLEESAQRGKA